MARFCARSIIRSVPGVLLPQFAPSQVPLVSRAVVSEVEEVAFVETTMESVDTVKLS